MNHVRIQSSRGVLRRRRTFSLVAALLAAIAPVGAVADITYDVAAVDLANGYAVAGTIVTDGTLGVLNAGNFLSWTITVTGPRPFVFTELSPDVSLSVESVTATPTELATQNLFGIVAKDNSPADCLVCEQRIEWSDVNGDRINYQYRDNFDGNPFVVARLTVPESPIVIATAPVPLPSSLVLLAGGMTLLRRIPAGRMKRAR